MSSFHLLLTQNCVWKYIPIKYLVHILPFEMKKLYVIYQFKVNWVRYLLSNEHQH